MLKAVRQAHLEPDLHSLYMHARVISFAGSSANSSGSRVTALPNTALPAQRGRLPVGSRRPTWTGMAAQKGEDVASKFGWDPKVYSGETKQDYSEDPQVQMLPVAAIRRPVPRSNSACRKGWVIEATTIRM